jgi:DNA-binding IclR family transcriptional regulator
MVRKQNQNICNNKRLIMSEMYNFINEKMKVLLVISENSMEIDGVKVCPLNQQEIANQVPCGKPKVNQIIRELTDEGYVETMRTKGRYILTEKAEILVKGLLDN